MPAARALVFVPVLFLDGLSARFPTVGDRIHPGDSGLACGGAHGDAALSLMLLPSAAGHKRHDAPLARGPQGHVRRILPLFLFRPKLRWRFWRHVVVTGIAVPGWAKNSATSWETDFLMHWVEKPGTSSRP